LVCLGRTDDQVKIRGFRVELGEVEAVVTQYPGVREAAIVVREDQPGQKVLCAYVVPHAQQTVDSGALRQALRQTLPDYMVPSFIVLLEQLPLSGTGKVDRKALPAPQAEHLGMQDQYEAPRNPTEETLAQLWSELLGIEPIGINSSFFELGGHSLLVM
jgi:acyl-coenzyme A synthetase/AMP-(fatty) acid ligase